jgi:hypothetical protein
MKQIERERRIAQDDATDDEVGLIVRFESVELIVSRTTFCRQHLLMNRPKRVMIASGPSLPHAVGHM